MQGPARSVEEEERTRRISNSGRDLMREGFRASSSGEFQVENPSTSVSAAQIQIGFRQSGRETVSNHGNTQLYHLESSSEEEEDDVEWQGSTRAPLVGVLNSAQMKEQHYEVITSERPLRAIEPLHNPVDISQIVPDSEHTFDKECFIVVHVWREEEPIAVAGTGSSSSSLLSGQPATALRKSLSSSRRSLTSAFSNGFSLLGEPLSSTNAPTSALQASAMDESANSMSPATLRATRSGERRFVELVQAGKDEDEKMELSRKGLGSDYTIFNRDWSVLLRGKKTSARWNQVKHKRKHADVDIFVGLKAEVPVARLTSGARASRLLYLERQSDGGMVYTFVKDKIAGYRVYWILEGRKANQQMIDPNECRFALVIRKRRAFVKAKTGDQLLIPHLAPSAKMATHKAVSSVFSILAMDVHDAQPSSPGATNTTGEVKIASGMDLILAFACLILADRFESFGCFIPNEKVRKQVLEERFESGVGDREYDVFHKFDGNFKAGTALGANALMY